MSEDIESKIANHESRIIRLEENQHQFHLDLVGMKMLLGTLATKQDLSEAVNGLLKDALNAVPAKQALVWTILAVILTAGCLAVAFHH